MYEHLIHCAHFWVGGGLLFEVSDYISKYYFYSSSSFEYTHLHSFKIHVQILYRPVLNFRSFNMQYGTYNLARIRMSTLNSKTQQRKKISPKKKICVGKKKNL